MWETKAAEREIVQKEEMTLSKCCPDLQGGEVLEQHLKLEGGELRPPAAAGLLIQPVSEKGS